MKNIISILFFIPLYGFAQSVIYDFEIKSKEIEIKLNQSHLYNKCVWNNNFNGDLFSVFSKNNETKIPQNEYGEETSLNGNSYVGFFGYVGGNKNGEDERTYITIKLDEPLEKNKIYQISWDLSLAEKSNWTVNNVGIIFSEGQNSNIEPIFTNEIITDYKWRYLTNSFGWETHGTTYVAKGGEKYLTFGNFTKNEFYKYKRFILERVEYSGEFDREDFAYYYLDNIKLSEIETLDESPFYTQYQPNLTFVGGTLDDPSWDDIKKIENQTIYFSHNKTVLNLNTKSTLDFLAQFLVKNKELNITLFISLDEIEKLKENNLAKSRYDGVVLYLRNKNVKNNINFQIKNCDEFDEDKEVYYAKNRKINFKVTK